MCTTTYEPIETIYFYYRCDGSRFMWSRVIGPNNYVFWFFLWAMLRLCVGILTTTYTQHEFQVYGDDETS